jgi:SAM-dependent methyltransferase
MNIRKRRKSALRRAEINENRQKLRGWYTRLVGRLLLEMEREQMSQVLNNLFGYHALQVGCLLGDDLLASSRIPHQILMDMDPNKTETLCNHVFGYPDALPIVSDSIDVILLPHTLEFERDPHQILREVDRALIPEGHAVILGFNPWSLWGLWRLLTFRRSNPPWCGSFLSLTRIKDWLALLGFDVVLIKPFFFRPPIQQEGIMRRLRFMEKLGARFWPRLSGAYVLVAKKRVATLTPIKPRWRPRRALVGAGKLAGPTARRYGRR